MRTLAATLLLSSVCAISGWGQSLQVLNAASFLANEALTPGTIVSIFGYQIATVTAQAGDPQNLPTALGGVSVKIGNTPLTLFYTSPDQVNALIGPGIAPGSYQLTLTSSAGTFSTPITISATAAPGVFSVFGTGTRDGAILNALTFSPGPFTVTTHGAPTYLSIYVTGLNLSTAPTVTIGGTPVNVTFYGNAPCCAGLQQINVELPPSLAGAGRVEVAVNSSGMVSNVVEVVILPSPGQGAFPPPGENQPRARELADVAWVPGTHTALIADEEDDVVRLADLNARQIVHVIDLPSGSGPNAVAVNAAGTLAVATERDNASVALIDLTTAAVIDQIPTGGGPSAVAFYNNLALVANEDSNTISVIDVTVPRLLATIPAARGPRAVAIDPTAAIAYIAAEDGGTIVELDLNTLGVINRLPLGLNSRPKAIEVMPPLGFALVVEPSNGPGDDILAVNLSNGTIQTTGFQVAAAGDNALAVYGNYVYFADQTGSSITIAKAGAANGQLTLTTESQVPIGLGPRSLAIDTLDNLLLASNEGDGTLALLNLSTLQLAGTIDAVKAEGESQGEDDHHDRGEAQNQPLVTGVQPPSIQPGLTVTLTLTGMNLEGATGLDFIDPSNSQGNGDSERHRHSDHNGHGPFSNVDPNFTVTGLQVSPDGTQLTAVVTLALTDTPGPRIVAVLTPNGESNANASPHDTITIAGAAPPSNPGGNGHGNGNGNGNGQGHGNGGDH